jgi:predicted  nucleic acid-binding Zn-ribbon protein
MNIECVSCDGAGTSTGEHKGDDVLKCEECESILYRDMDR